MKVPQRGTVERSSPALTGNDNQPGDGEEKGESIKKILGSKHRINANGEYKSVAGFLASAVRTVWIFMVVCQHKA